MVEDRDPWWWRQDDTNSDKDEWVAMVNVGGEDIGDIDQWQQHLLLLDNIQNINRYKQCWPCTIDGGVTWSIEVAWC